MSEFTIERNAVNSFRMNAKEFREPNNLRKKLTEMDSPLTQLKTIREELMVGLAEARLMHVILFEDSPFLNEEKQELLEKVRKKKNELAEAQQISENLFTNIGESEEKEKELRDLKVKAFEELTQIAV